MTQFYEIAIDPNFPERLYGGTQDNGTIRTLTGNLDDWRQIHHSDGFYVIVDPRDSNTIYAEIQRGGLIKITSTNRVSATNGIPPHPAEPHNWSTPVVMDPQNPDVLYYGTNRVYRTLDGAESWTAVSDELTEGRRFSPLLGTISTIAVAPTDTSVVYARDR